MQIWTEDLFARTYDSTNSLVIPDFGAAAPYPSAITVAGATGNVVQVTVTIHGLSHPWPADVDLLLQAPGGQTIQLMGGSGSAVLQNATLTFSDASTVLLPVSGPIFSGSYQPTVNGLPQPLPPPAPPGPYGRSFSSLNGLSPNGVWSLYAADSTIGDAGWIGAGWTLNLRLSTNSATQPPSNWTGLAQQTNQLFLGHDGGPLPTVPGLKVTAQTAHEGQLPLHLKLAPAGSAVLERSANAVDWEPVFTNSVWARSILWTDTPLEGQGGRLYRARVYP
jgi:subtilisin-like proprotein convertase family protein